jgi:hypothetical protein
VGAVFVVEHHEHVIRLVVQQDVDGAPHVLRYARPYRQPLWCAAVSWVDLQSKKSGQGVGRLKLVPNRDGRVFPLRQMDVAPGEMQTLSFLYYPDMRIYSSATYLMVENQHDL